ncbi:short-chain dehydrogenase/reductase SDR [Thermotomaculum hydrothermale]|uniref:Short-chain dehydrogenase/reductase SDR n=1 Tax=Thermotomaculum hydrothermale TaxID=981385 RepID=A0A7R6T025_9BACT|nr:SDR family NAD(P)-dependent oxidoreductase [Thermotomaculum hydrothermale]BBB33360.1 short-chain dehydrogenase/reductase SDR [Thermotomaculum hydrothermale]
MNIAITGASSGIGYGLAKRYIKKGHTLFLFARRKEKLEELKELAPDRVNIYPVDITDFEKFQEILNDILKENFIDIAIANAGTSTGHGLEVPDFQSFKKTYHLNVLGVHAFLEPIVKKMIENKKGKAVVISSLASIIASPSSTAYSSTKRALNSYCESLRNLGHFHNVKVINIMPGFIKTPLTAKNKFKMPFLMELDYALNKIEYAIEKNKKEYAFPKFFYFVLRFLSCMPAFVRDFILKKTAKKVF